MCTDFQGFSKPLFNNKPVNVQRHKRFIIVNCAAIPKNLTAIFYSVTKTFTMPLSSKVEYIFPSIRLLLVGWKTIFYE